MPDLFKPEIASTIVMRIARLKSDAAAVWGKMNVAQMLAHCQVPLEVALGDRTLKQSFIGKLFGKTAKKKLLKEQQFPQHLPTDASFVIKGQRQFEQEKDKLMDLIRRFTETNPAKIASKKHPFFGNMSAEEWGVLSWKHLDHHLRQFGI